jgi:Skp family chaperone for outer membrane proteins
MKLSLAPALAGFALALAVPTALVSTPALAQAARGVAIVNVQAVIANSNALRTAEQQRPVTYKAQYDAATAKRTQLEAQLKPLVEKFNRDRTAANAAQNQASLQQQAASLQQLQDQGNRELQTILQPVALSSAYVEEQIGAQLQTAISNAAKKKNMTLVVSAEGVLYVDPAYNLSQDVLAELNTLLPSAQLVPPAGWLPRELREQQEAAQQQAAAQGGAAPAAPAPTTTQPTGR